MIKFIVCDDNESIVSSASTIINKIMMPGDTDYKICKFYDYNKEMKNIIFHDKCKKIYLLDIELPTISGLEIASKIRANDFNSSIIFLTAHGECINDVFTSRLVILDYISKFLNYEERLAETIKYALKIALNDKFLTFRYRGTLYQLNYDEILYIEKQMSNSKSIIFTEDGREIELIRNINDLLEELSPTFQRPHKSFLVNVNKIRSMDLKSGIVTFKNGKKADILSKRGGKKLFNYIFNLNR
ncbi:MAG: LytTR family DNA-binding domain-containing protein [bacterium]|nr:LytTR family DNA-binding domain-containing protein [bacterium]